MESLSETTWDVVVSGTGLAQSLLALALSRSGKKVLHLDRNDYYGGTEAALSLDEAENWAASARDEESQNHLFREVTVQRLEEGALIPNKLGFSRAYSLTLSPQLIYTRSNLLPALVSSKVYRQLEFLAVGSWWIYNTEGTKVGDLAKETNTSGTQDWLRKIPSSREDVVNDTSIDLRSQRNVMRFLQLATDAEAHSPILEKHASLAFPEFLSTQFKIPGKLHAPLVALTLSPDRPQHTSTAYALPRIHRHLTSIGMFGPGFGAVIPKWGGLAEVAQVACRASAVGGGVYVLNKAIKEVSIAGKNQERRIEEAESTVRLQLAGDEDIKAKHVVGSHHDLPNDQKESKEQRTTTARSVTIISSPLLQLFTPQAEGAPPPAAAVVAFPTGTLTLQKTSLDDEHPPVYLMIHSSDTGECPAGQCVIYAQTSTSALSVGYSILSVALDALLATLHETPKPEVLWSLQYMQEIPIRSNTTAPGDQILRTADIPSSFVLEDDVLRDVRSVWECIVGEEKGDGFMTFEDREGAGDDEGEDAAF